MSHIDFKGRKYTAVSDLICTLAAESAVDKRMSLPWRIWELALGRMNNWGHAGFRRDELATLATGKREADVERIDRQRVWKYVKVLKAMGRIAPASTSLCLVVRHDLAQRPRGKGSYGDLCCEPAHHDLRLKVWEPAHGWIDPKTGVIVVNPSVAVVDPTADPWAA